MARLISILLFLLCLSGRATVYYLDATNGNNSANGTATNTPWLTLTKAGAAMRAGDLLYVRGGVYDVNRNGAYYQYFSPNYFTANGSSIGTQSSPIVVSNYPGESPLFINGNLDGVGIAPFYLGDNAWIKLFGLSCSNCRGESIIMVVNCTNCEVGYCNLGPTGTANTSTNAESEGIFAFGTGCWSNYIHDCTFHDAHQQLATGTNQVEGGDLCSFGDAGWSYLTNAQKVGFNVFFRNTMYHGGHSVLNPQGCTYSFMISNKCHNEIWIDWPSFNQLGGHGVARAFAGWCLYDGNDFGYAGNPLMNDGAEGLGLFGQNNIVRHNIIHHNEANAMDIYNKGVGDGSWAVTNNHIYNNTMVHNGLGQLVYTNYYNQGALSLGAKTNTGHSLIFLSGSTNSWFVNNIFAFNTGNPTVSQPTNSFQFRGSTVDSTALLKTNWFNNLTGDPKFLSDTNDLYYWGYQVGNPFGTNAQYEYQLQSTSPCIDAGTWLTTITSSSGSGTTVVVADPWYFWPGTTAAGTVFSGDTVQLQGQTTTSTITAIDYSTGTLTLNSSLTWTNGQGVALAYNGAAPDMGAFEAAGTAPPATVTATLSGPFTISGSGTLKTQ